MNGHRQADHCTAPLRDAGFPYQMPRKQIGFYMTNLTKLRLFSLVTSSILAGSLCQAAFATEIAGINFTDTLNLGGKDLQLNGAGVRSGLVNKMYVVGLYLQAKASTADEVLAAQGPRRITLVMLDDISSEDLGDVFIKGLNNNMDQIDKQKTIRNLIRFGEMFASVPGLRKGDKVDVDWSPETGMQCYVSSKKFGEAIPDLVLYNAILRIWVGANPSDPALKSKLLAAAAQK